MTMKTSAPPFFNHFSLSLNRKKRVVTRAKRKKLLKLNIRTENPDWNQSHEKGSKHIHASAGVLLHIKLGNLDMCKCGHCKNEVREIDCCREVDAMLIASAKIPKREGSISPSSFYGQLPDYY